jgi:chitodextrinase
VINVVKDEGFLYDTSIEDGWATGLDGSNYHWPYTLDAGSPGAIHKTTWDKAGGVPFLIGNYNGLWEIPVSPWIVPADDEDGLPYDLRAKVKANMSYFDMASGKITAFDYNLLVSAKLNDANDIFAIWKHSLDLRLQGNRAPLTIGIHAQNYQSATSPAAIALKRFVEYAASQTDVRLASHKQVVDWLENPRALDDIPNIIQASITPHTVTGQCTDTPWQASETYQEGDKVTYQDQTWTSGWYNSNSAPGASQWGPWGDSGVSCNGTETLYYGTMTPSVGAVAVEDHQAETFTFSPDNGKQLLQVTVDGVVVLPLPINGYSFSDVTGDHVIEATFGNELVSNYVVTASSGQHGSISPSGAVSVVEGKNQLFNFVPDANYKVQFVKVNGAEVQVINNQYEVQNVTADTSIAVTFVADDINPVVYTLSASAGLNGTITPIGDSQVNAGTSQLYTFTADSGYQLDIVSVDGVAVTVVNDQYLLENVSANTSINANFKPVDSNTCKDAWNASPGYPKGSVVSYEGYNWTAKWWSKNEVPVDQPWGNPWQKNTQPCG